MPKLLSPNEPPQKPSGGGGGGGAFKMIILLALLGAAGYFGWDYWKKSKGASVEAKTAAGGTNATKTVSTESKTNKNPIARAAATLQKWADRSSDQEPAKPTNAPAAKATTVAATAARPAGKPASEIPGMPKVQAIFYRPTDASAIIAGETVHNGDTIGGAKVLEIKRQSIRMQLGDEVHEVTIK